MKKSIWLLSLSVVWLYSCKSDENEPLKKDIVTVSTLAGSTEGFADGMGSAAKFYAPRGLAIDASGNVYVADEANHRIRKITPAGMVSTLAGSTEGFADGQGSSAQFNSPTGLVADAAGNLYVADNGNHRIRKITPAGEVSTLTGSSYGFVNGPLNTAKFANPYGVAIDATGNLYVADKNNHKVRKITTTGEVSTLAGSTQGFADGEGDAVHFDAPTGVIIDAVGNVYVADQNNHKIRKITSTGVVSTLAGSTQGFANGVGGAAQFFLPTGITIDAAGTIYVTDLWTHKIRKVTAAGEVSTLAGSTQGYADGSDITSQFNYPDGIVTDADGNVYISEVWGNRIRMIKTTK